MLRAGQMEQLGVGGGPATQPPATPTPVSRAVPADDKQIAGCFGGVVFFSGVTLGKLDAWAQDFPCDSCRNQWASWGGGGLEDVQN